MTIFGPVFHKELLELSRRRSTYFLRALAAVGLLLVVLIYANDTGRFGNLSTTRLQAAIGANIFSNWMWFQFWIVCGAMPLLVGGLISAERESGSLELLFTTQLTSREIVLGKLASRLFFTLLLVFSALPVLVILGLLGGIDLERLLKVNLLTLAAALLVATAGMYFSTIGKRPWIACLQTYGFFFFLWAVVPFTIIAFVELFIINRAGGGGGMPPRWCFLALFAAAPYGAVAMINEPRANAIVGWLFDWSGILTFSGLWLSISALFVILTIRGIRSGPQPSLAARLIAFPARFTLTILTKIFGPGVRLFSRRWSFRLPTFGLDKRNPIVWRNHRSGLYDPDGYLRRLQISGWLACGVMISLFFAMGRRGPNEFFPFMLGMEVAFLHVMIAAVASASVARERHRGSFDLVLLTKLTSSEIVFGTLQGVVWCCVPTIAMVAATLAAIVWDGAMTPAFAFDYGMTAGAYSLVLLASAVFISITAVRPSHAVAAAVVVALTHWFLPIPAGAAYIFSAGTASLGRLDWLMLAGLGLLAVFAVVVCFGFFLLGRGRPFVAAVILSICIPIALLLFVPVEHNRADVSLFWRWAADIESSYGQAIRNWRPRDPGLSWIPIFELAAAALIILLAIWRFDRIVERTPRRRLASESLRSTGPASSPADSTHPIPLNAAS